jgi:hypothetical protein
MKKISLIGAGTAGAISMISLLKHKFDFQNWKRDYFDFQIDWYFDPNIKSQPVGEGTSLAVPGVLGSKLKMGWDDLAQFDSTAKTGSYYYNFGKTDFLHGFPLGLTGIHFNAIKFQKYALDRFGQNTKVKIIESNVTSHDQIEGDYIIDCTGRPASFDNSDYIIPEYIAVNSVHVTQCYWDNSTFNHTKAIARPYGWVFLVPLNNRCSVGYLYNNTFNKLDDIKEDVLNVFDEWSLVPSFDTNSFSFNNYYKDKIIDGRSVYNGNKAFFLEPMEATSIDSMLEIMEAWRDNQTNDKLHQWFKECEYIIMMHYAVGSKWNTSFWDFAQERGQKCMEAYQKTNPDIAEYIRLGHSKYYHSNKQNFIIGPWGLRSLKINLENLGFING